MVGKGAIKKRRRRGEEEDEIIDFDANADSRDKSCNYADAAFVFRFHFVLVLRWRGCGVERYCRGYPTTLSYDDLSRVGR